MRIRRSSDPLGAATARAQYEAPATINAPLLQSLIRQLAEDRRWVILDLGAARSQTIGLMNRFRCRLDITDLAESLDMLNASDADELSERAEAVLPQRHAEPADIVLCWDFLNYMERGTLRALMARVAARCRPGALVHALIVYSERRMQREPGQFAPVGEGRLLNLSRAKLERIAPRYSTEDLAVCLPDYIVERAWLLGNGMQEYLLRVERA